MESADRSLLMAWRRNTSKTMSTKQATHYPQYPITSYDSD